MGSVNADDNGRAAPAYRDADSTEWYRRYRPRRLKRVVGQEAAVDVLNAYLRDGFPHALMLTGPSGVGKSTLARIIADELRCGTGPGDYNEINCASLSEPLATVRNIEQRMRIAPCNGDCKVYLLEEIQSLSRAGFAQQALLLLLENAPAHVFFLLATTDPQKVLPAIRTRCSTVALKALTDTDIEQTIRAVADRAGYDLSDEVCARVVECAGGSARKAVVDLQQVSGLIDDTARLAALRPPEVETNAFEIVRMLVWQKPDWKKLQAFLKDFKGADESLRASILTNARNELLKPNGSFKRAASIIDWMRDPWYDNGDTRLAYACYRVMEEGGVFGGR